jgi:DNA-binding NarL/FixJ family response regulator
MESAVGVLIIETNQEVRRALTLWINRIPGYHCAGAFSNAQAALRPAAVKSAGLILFNRNLPGLPEGKGLAECDGRIAGLPAFGFGTYAESDDIFSSLTGVSGGYFLRRRPPLEMLEPITGAWNHGALAAGRLVGQIPKYFQNLFGQSPPNDDAQSKVSLTPREQEILLRLSKGYPDKQIADGLNISAWTVHNHMKNIFKKLGVHTRTEAVIRYLQK